MGHMPRVHGRPIDQLGQVSGSAAYGSGRYLEADDGEVHPPCVRTEIIGGFWYGATMWGYGCRNQEGYSRDASLVGAERSGG